ncbi:acyltransferase family protein [Thalassotalea agarivorans]|uniref:Peptidoglycan/LPS O-acetylase OafA/YrhL, contains acyltransferase and SGNH-hydrolase domains n=1 Tax=Thalassotalea agarivorans TaxID=349064 RepID=A0A1I0E7R1_THASX|nr:acyltransferase family protein [Thalassotalea agarivorans]SET41218.1 Peptidoglycan/LPS O-acetylase OafA/YrhL, contains acyltransferase and SGNH-hydrolase domains [Thalassotalea agarivorans]
MLTYRPEIDGLRAFAVIPVVLFHAGLLGVSGGYAGVDVFFVISGYLITSILLKDLDAGRYSLVNFYERRARRILPALLAMVIVTTLVALAIMPTELLKSYANSVLAVLTFTSNFHFFAVSDYFSTAAEQKPLLHTWSLAVEEQYYLFFPLLLAALYSKKRKLGWVLVGLTLCSLLFAQTLATLHYVDANFYLIFSRAWELFFGALIAYWHLDKTSTHKAVKSVLAIVGLVMIIGSYVLFDHATPFPSIYTILPVLGTCLVICCADKNNIVGKVLSIKAIVYVGLLSYSLYLWHQPIFAFLRMKTFGEPSVEAFVFAIALSGLLAYLSYRYVETPFRRKTSVGSLSILKGSGVALLSVMILAGIILAGKGFPQRFENAYQDSIVASPMRKQCHTFSEDYLPAQKACQYNQGTTTWALFGDSHLVELGFALADRLNEQDQSLLHLTFSGCAPALSFEVIKPGCHRWFRESLEFLVNNKQIKHVLFGFRTSSFLYGEHDKVYPHIPAENANHRLTNEFHQLSSEQAAEMYWQDYVKALQKLLDSGKQVYVLFPVPEIPDDINTILTPFSIFGGSYSYDLTKTTPLSYYEQRNAFVLSKLRALPFDEQLKPLKPTKALCSQSHCAAVLKNKSMYFDNNHLSLDGAKAVISLIPLH